MKILISGSNGLLGYNLKNYFDLRKIKYSTIGQKNCDFEGDISNNKFVEVSIKKFLPNIFINLAAVTDVDYCELNKNEAYKINTEFPEVISKTLEQTKKDSYMIHISTDQVYNGAGPHIEENAHPINQYSITKHESEKKLSNFNSICLRTNFFGNSKNINKLSFSDRIIKSCKHKLKINIFNDVYFSPVSFLTIFKVLEKLMKKKIIGIYNLGSKNGMSKKDFAIYLCECFNLDSNYIVGNSLKSVNLEAKRPFDMRLDSSKLEKDLNINLMNLTDEIKSLKFDK